MSQIKADLICEIIRLSQRNLLGRKALAQGSGLDEEKAVVDWIRNNAAEYRKYFMAQLEGFSSTELGDLFKMLSESGKDLDQVMQEVPAFSKKKYCQ